MSALTESRAREVENRWHHRTGAWKAPFDVKLNDVMVHAFYDADDYDEIRSHLTERFG